MTNTDCLFNSLKDFQDFIDSNKLKSLKEFREKHQYLYGKYIRTFSKEDRKLIFEEEKYHQFGNKLLTVNDFQEFIDNNKITKPMDIRKNYPKIYDRMCRMLTKKEKMQLNYLNRVNSYENITTVTDLQQFIDLNNIHSKKELHKRFPGLYVKFSNQLNNVKFYFNNHSLGENFLIRLFEKNNINYETQKTYKDLKNIFPFRFDFFLPDFNTLIEHHGESHFGKGKYYTESLIKNDKIKYDYAIKNNIKVLYFTIYKSDYKKLGYFTEVITDPEILIQRIYE